MTRSALRSWLQRHLQWCQLLVGLVLLLTTTLAAARPGGGDTYSGGGGHSSSGGDDGGGGDGGVVFEIIARLIIELLFHYPQVGVPLLIAAVLFYIWLQRQRAKNQAWDSGPPVELARRASYQPLLRQDPLFSTVTFEDFAMRLYASVQLHRGSDAEVASLAPYVSAEVRGKLNRQLAVPTQAAIVGAMRLVSVSTTSGQTSLSVEFEANITGGPNGREQTYFTVERWTFSRAAGVQSKAPRQHAMTTLPCPNCGAPWAASAAGSQVCASCNEVVDNGRFDWVVTDIAVLAIDQRPPTLSTNVVERGTDLPTYRDDNVDADFAALAAADPNVTKVAVLRRFKLIYDQLNVAWTANDLRPVRGLLSPGVFDSLQYWINVHQKHGVQNVLRNMTVTKTELARVSRDANFDSVTLRFWATGLDFVVDARGKLMRGSKTKARPYSEYWTLIRAVGTTRTPNGDTTCSNCGAPLQVSAAGECEHCQAYLVGGKFDWVLSKIEQDDSYRG